MNNERVDYEELFFKRVIECYNDVRRKYTTLDNKGKNPNLIRGRQASISDAVEDLFADYLRIKLDNSNLLFYVDCPFSYKNDKNRTVTFYPDIAVIEDNNDGKILRSMIDLKIDAGWFRDSMVNIVANHKNRADEIISKTIRSSKLLKREEIRVSKDCKYDIVLVTTANGGKNIQQVISDVKSKNTGKGCNVFVLSTGVHPNTEGDKIVDKVGKFGNAPSVHNDHISLYDKEFENIIKRICI